MKTRSIIYFVAAIFFLSCGESKKESAKTGQIEEIVEQTRTEFAPDKRVALFDISAEEDENGIILKGETNSEEAKKDFYQILIRLGLIIKTVFRFCLPKNWEKNFTGSLMFLWLT